MKILSWNVNGIAACRRKGFLKFLSDTKPDVICCQEIKAVVPLDTPGYTQFWNPAKRPGYAGTLILANPLPLSCTTEMGCEQFDDEGRFILIEYESYYIANLYAPNVWGTLDRLDRRLEWDKALLDKLSGLNKPVILCGDFNVAHGFLDSYPENARNTPEHPRFSSEARAGMDKLLSLGFVDAFRAFYPEKPGVYTWWSPKNNNRLENRGSRLDYFLVPHSLIDQVRSVRHHTQTQGSDHCPISMVVHQEAQRREISGNNLAAMWQATDWSKMKEQLFQMQKELAQAADQRDWTSVEKLQDGIVRSWAARMLAVRSVASVNSSAGVDGVKLDTDEKKMAAALSLTPRGYRPLPYRHREVEVGEKKRILHIATAHDKAMQVLYAYTLDPVAETISDRKSFFSRRGRSAHDLHAYLCRSLTARDAPEWIVKVDVKTYYSSIIHRKLIELAPMDKTVLRKFLKAGVVKDGELFATDKGISLGTSISPILGNILLNGLQSYIFDQLYPAGNVDYQDGDMYRFSDDILVTARSYASAERIFQIIRDFLAERGLKPNEEKSYIANIREGVTFLSRHYRRKDGILTVQPSSGSVKKCERELEALILNHKGPLRELVEAVNDKLTGWGAYHRLEDSYMAFRHIDAVATGLLVKRLCGRHPRWHRETILGKYFVKDGGTFVFQLPDDSLTSVMQLAPTRIVRHKPCKLDFNPYLDDGYHRWLQGLHEVQKANGKYRAVWQRQGGRCAYCGHEMLPDQEVQLVERRLGLGWKTKNLLYIHTQCAYDVFHDSDESKGAPLDLFSMLEGFLDDAPTDESPYLELTEYFRLAEQSPISLTFRQIEEILGEPLDWEAFFFEAFWYDDGPGYSTTLWQKEGFPFHFFLPSRPEYSIADSWLSQGYKIKSLYLSRQQVVFRKTAQGMSGLAIPKALTARKLPDGAVYEAKKFFSYLIKKYGL